MIKNSTATTDFHACHDRLLTCHKVDDDYLQALTLCEEMALATNEKKQLIPVLMESLERLAHELWHENADSQLQQNIIHTVEGLLTNLLAEDLHYREHELLNFCRFLKPWSYQHMQAHHGKPELSIRFPMLSFLQQFEFTFQRFGMTIDVINYFQSELQKIELFRPEYMQAFYQSEKEAAAVQAKFASLVEMIDLKNREKTKPFNFPAADVGEQFNHIIQKLNASDVADEFQAVFYHASLLKTNKPPKAFFKAISPIVNDIGLARFRSTMHDMLQIAADYPLYDYPHYITEFADVQTLQDYLCAETKHFVKGLVWALKDHADIQSMAVLAALLEKSYTKIDAIGPACKLVGNAVIAVLGSIASTESLAALYHAKHRIKHPSAKKLIDKQLEAGAKKLGVSVENLGEMAVPDFGFE